MARATPGSSHTSRRALAVLVGFIAFWGTCIFANRNLVVKDQAQLAAKSRIAAHDPPWMYRVECCGIVVAKDDNLDGRHIDNTVVQLRLACGMTQAVVSVACGILVGCTVNTLLRLVWLPPRDARE